LAPISQRELAGEETLNSGVFVQIAMGSARELEYHLLLAKDLEILKSLDYERLSEEVIEVKRMLASLLVKLES
jgi:four helix bundle protein